MSCILQKRRLLFSFCCASNHQKIGAQQPLPRVNYLSGKKVDKFDSKSDFFFLFEIREHSLCWYSKPTQLFVISSTVCILIYLCMDSRFNLIIQINFSMTQMYSYSLVRHSMNCHNSGTFIQKTCTLDFV